MAHTKRSVSRSRLFSLSARAERRSRRDIDIDITIDEAPHGDDDGCPMCIALRTGGDPNAFFPGPNGEAPPIPEDYLIKLGLKAIAESKPTSEEPISIMEFGSRVPTGEILPSAFSVDRHGRIFWKSWSEERFVLQIPAQA